MRAAIERAVSVLGLPVAEETLYEKVKEVLMRSPEREEFHASLSRFGLRFSVDIGMWVEEPADDAEGVN
jgi:hypothetical protein